MNLSCITARFSWAEIPQELRKMYQINSTRDEDWIKFLGMDSLPAFRGNQDINSKIHDKMYQGSAEAASL